jgi:drug/metabolite transporter superfamily protein YnfA
MKGCVMTQEVKVQPQGSSTAIGALLIVLGIFLLIAQQIDFDLGRYGWPFFIIVPGVVLFGLALAIGGGAGEGLTVFGSIVTMTGVLLFYQNSSNHFESWAYAWALVAPTSIGIGQIIYGTVKNQAHIVKTGRNLAAIGAGIFLVGAIFFELVIGISGHSLSGLGWAMLLIGLGVILLLSNFLPTREKSE